MITELRDHVCFLAKELGDTIRYEVNITVDSPTNRWPTYTEQHRLNPNKHVMVTALSFKQVLDLKASDFIKEHKEDE